MESSLPEQIPTHTPLPRNLIIVLGIIVVIVLITAFYLYQNQKPTQSKPILSYKVTEGTVTDVNPKSITVKEASGQIVAVLIDQPPVVNQQTISIPTQKQPSSGSAQLLYSLVSTIKINFSDIKVGDKAKITFSEKDGKFYAQSITITKEKKSQ